MQRHRFPAMLLIIGFASSVLSGCGTSRNIVTVQDASEITKGRELIDLQRARAEGAIDERDYETLRQTILRRPR